MYTKNGKINFSKRDTWSLNDTLRPIIAQGLLKFRECIDGSKVMPFSVIEGCVDSGLIEWLQEDIGSISAESWEVVEKYYLDCLDKMIYAFTEPQPELPCYAKGQLKDSEVKAIFKEYREVMIEYNKRVQEGTELFGKYYHTLWW